MPVPVMTNDDIITAVLRREAGFVNDPDDPGGATNRGITLKRWRKYTGRPGASVAELRGITEAQARRFYLREHIVAPGFDAISNPPLRSLVVDCGVHHGTEDATRFLQEAVGGLVLDGIFGPKTRAAVNAADPLRVYLRVCGVRVRDFGSLITVNPKLSKFAKGWTRRVAEFIDAAPL